MTQHHSKKIRGFTLVELAIVVTIIGLLIGGILKGQEMITISRVAATVSHFQAYRAAAITFKDTYDALPGDLANAPTKLRGCTLGCTIGAADGFIGNPGRLVWGNTENGDMGQTTPGDAVRGNGSHRAGGETWLFWMHLLKSDLINSVTDEGLQNSITLRFGSTHPAIPVGGGLFLRMNPAAAIPPGSTASNPASGPTRIIVFTGRDASGGQMDIQNNMGLTTAIAQMIDTKADDGLAWSGDIHGYGANCFMTGTDTSYDTSRATRNSCGLVVSLLK